MNRLDMEAVSALAFSPSGEALAGFCAADSSVRVWSLATSWTHRLQQRLRGPLALLPEKLVPVTFPEQAVQPLARAMTGSAAIDLTYRLCWESERRIAVMHEGRYVAVIV